MVSWHFALLLISFAFASQNVHRLSPSTHTFISRELGGLRNGSSLSSIRYGGGIPIRRAVASVVPVAPVVQMDSGLQNLKDKLVETILNYDSYNFEEFFYDLNDQYPGIDHINQLYDDDSIGGSRGLLHFAVMGRNADIVRVLIDNNINPNLTDSNNFTALEYACNEALPDMMALLIRRFGEKVVLRTFLGYETFAHYAAAHNRTDMIAVISVNDAFPFTEPPQKRFNWTPLELALSHGHIDAAETLIEFDAFYRPENIQLIHLNNLSDLKSNYRMALFMCSQYRGLVYLTNEDDMDMMLLAIKYDLINVVISILNDGYNEKFVEYNLLEAATKLNASNSIMTILQNFNKN